MHNRAGQRAQPEDLTDIDALLAAYHEVTPDPGEVSQRVEFGTSGHRGSSLNGSFNDAHIAATTQAIVEYRTAQGTTGPVFLGRDTHALSAPSWSTALEVLAANRVDVMVDAADRFTPTPAISHSILRYNATAANKADGIVVTPSHNPPQDGGFKYNPPHGGPADGDATSWIADRANELLEGANAGVHRLGPAAARSAETTHNHDFMGTYVADLENVVDVAAIRNSGVRIGADPMGGAAVDYWAAIGDHYALDLEVVNPLVDPQWSFMTLDWDGKIRMDCSSPNAMASLVAARERYDISTGNDADADRHGIVTPDAGLMNPNHFLAVAIEYLFSHREGWGEDTAIGKTLVSSSMIDRVASSLNQTLIEVPVGFKWFVPGLLDGSVGFGGEESAGASFLRKDGSVWTTDKDGLILCLLASEIQAVTGNSPSQRYASLTDRFGAPAYARIDAPATREQKATLKALRPEQVEATDVGGEPIVAKLTEAPGNGAAIGGLKVQTENAWFAARPSGTEDVYKIYAESFLGSEHLAQVQAEAKSLVDEVL
ncbi:MAG: phosphoglucomutase (alpha-D-glucose-1,6-bisphosphate-dependent) [Acidimicrobiia bacterium]|nr:phosphoglucomutase (alpha-D-glucose-1,6-bisphosphate-dependent) [Acidimicrobiia bacterium]